MSVITVESEEQLGEIMKHPRLVLECFADWCGPCKMIFPKLTAWAAEHLTVSIARVNVDDFEEYVEGLKIDVMPTFIYYRNGTETTRVLGANQAAVEEAIIKLEGAQ